LSDLVVSFESVKQKGLSHPNCLLRALCSNLDHNYSCASYDTPRSSAKTAGKWLFECSATSGHGEVSLAKYGYV
jgi:hypothetical protein